MYIRDAGEFLIAILTVIEEASHSLGQHLIVVGDEALPGATYMFAVEQGAGREAAEDLQDNILCEAGQWVPVVGGRLHFEEPTIVSVQYDESFLSNEITKKENNPTKIYQ